MAKINYAVSEQPVAASRSEVLRIILKSRLFIWRGNPPGLALEFIALVTALVMFLPVLYVIIRGIQGGLDRWVSLLDSRIPQLLFNTLSLTTVVTAGALVLGVSTAWLINRSDLPGRKIWEWLLALPLVIPPYVGAVSYIIVFGPRGLVRNVLVDFPINIYSFTGVALLLTLFTYPYVYLVAGAALKRFNHNYEEAGRIAGLSYFQVILKIVLPLLRPAMGAGAILVALYSLSDFGLVAMLRYTTFTTAIYYQMGSFDRLSAAILSVVLIILTLFLLGIEYSSRRKKRYFQSTGTYRKPAPVPLGRGSAYCFAGVGIIVSLALVLPVSVLLYWSYAGIVRGALDSRFWEYAHQSLLTAGLAAIACAVLALPLVYLKSRHPGLISSVYEKLALAGYALPGVIIALGMVFIFNQYLPGLYGTSIVLVVAYVIRFLPQAMQAESSSLSQVSPRLDEAGRSLGFSPRKVIARVILPLIRPGILAGMALVFVSAVKELPATLVLRPPGMDTLAVRIWIEASEGFYDMAAPASLLIILISALPLKWLINKF
jgi:iron(III) transport system permease protein